MRQFIVGVVLGSLLSGSIVVAGLYDRDGQPSGPRGSIQQYDYFRGRQQQLDVQALRRQAEQERASRRVPCPNY